jgi:hypothetical protein
LIDLVLQAVHISIRVEPAPGPMADYLLINSVETLNC